MRESSSAHSRLSMATIAPCAPLLGSHPPQVAARRRPSPTSTPRTTPLQSPQARACADARPRRSPQARACADARPRCHRSILEKPPCPSFSLSLVEMGRRSNQSKATPGQRPPPFFLSNRTPSLTNFSVAATSLIAPTSPLRSHMRATSSPSLSPLPVTSPVPWPRAWARAPLCAPTTPWAPWSSAASLPDLRRSAAPTRTWLPDTSPTYL